MGPGGVAQGEHGVDDGLEFAVDDGGFEVALVVAGDGGALDQGGGAHDGAEDLEALAEDEAEVGLGGRAAHQSDQHQAALGGERVQVRVEVVAADDVEDHVDAVAAGALFDDFLEGVFVVVDGDVCAEPFGVLALVVAAGGDPDFRADQGGDLDGGDADAAAAGVDQDALAGLGAAEGADRGVGGEEDLGDRGGLVPGEGFGDVHRQGLVQRGDLGVAAPAGESVDAVAELEAAHAVAEADHFAGQFEAEDGGTAGQRRVAAEALEDVGAVERGRMHAQQQFLVARNRVGNFRELERVGRLAVARDHDRLHCPPPFLLPPI